VSGLRCRLVAAAAALGHRASARCAFLHRMQVPRGGALRSLRHGRVREAPTVVRGDVRARETRESDGERQKESNAHAQLFGAPAAAHEAISFAALELELVPEGGMSPPSQLRRDRLGSAIGALVVRMSPLVVSHV
jgi:hypothetical protein